MKSFKISVRLTYIYDALGWFMSICRLIFSCLILPSNCYLGNIYLLVFCLCNWLLTAFSDVSNQFEFCENLKLCWLSIRNEDLQFWCLLFSQAKRKMQLQTVSYTWVSQGDSSFSSSVFWCLLLDNWTRSSGAIKRLSDNGLLDPGAIVKTDEAAISSLIYPVGASLTYLIISSDNLRSLTLIIEV